MSKHDKKNLKKKLAVAPVKPVKKSKPVHKASTPVKVKKKGAKPEIKVKAKAVVPVKAKPTLEKKMVVKPQPKAVAKADPKAAPRTFAEISGKKSAPKKASEVPPTKGSEVSSAKVKTSEKTPPKLAEVEARIAAGAPLRKVSKPKKTESSPAEILGEPIDFSQLEDEANDEVVLTDAEGRRYCRTKDCDQLSSVEGYCRYHYLLYWKKIQLRKKILVDGKLEKYVEDLTARYPDKYIEMIRRDLKTEKDFMSAVQELEIDDSGVESDLEEEAEGIIDEVRGISRPSGREDDDF